MAAAGGSRKRGAGVKWKRGRAWRRRCEIVEAAGNENIK
jgi:hypothetical protein